MSLGAAPRRHATTDIKWCKLHRGRLPSQRKTRSATVRRMADAGLSKLAGGRFATRPTAITSSGRSNSIARRANTEPAVISATVGRRLESGSPGRWGWWGTVFHRITSCSASSSRSTRWTIVPEGSLQPSGRGLVVRYGGAPAQEVALAGERDARPAHALVARRLAQRDHPCSRPLVQVVAQVVQTDSALRSGVLVEGRADAGSGEIPEQLIHGSQLDRQAAVRDLVTRPGQMTNSPDSRLAPSRRCRAPDRPRGPRGLHDPSRCCGGRASARTGPLPFRLGRESPAGGARP